MSKTVAAFAIGDGGTMVFGIDPDELTVPGLNGEDPKKLRDRLYYLVHRTVVPSPDVTIEDHQVAARPVRAVVHTSASPAEAARSGNGALEATGSDA
jgi:predicted HTH transcriptional regulator